ncbi:sulfite exporter TauE/SafE family protein [Amylibacter sp.]|nr:sulfite exporter TauE/SafE family protein [Amylibacter sp.]
MFDQLFTFSFAVMLIVVYFSGIIRGYTGFGSALLTVPALAILFGPVQAVAIEILIEIPVSIGLLPKAIKSFEKKTVLPILLTFVIFVPLGTFLLILIDPNIVKIVISLFVLFSVYLLSQQSQIKSLISTKANLIIGALSGFSQGLTGMAGPFFATALLARGDSSSITRANIVMLSSAIIGLSVASFFIFGLITNQTIFYALMASPAILLGAWTGSVLFEKYSSKNFKTVMLCVLIVSALFTLFDSLYFR